MSWDGGLPPRDPRGRGVGSPAEPPAGSSGDQVRSPVGDLRGAGEFHLVAEVARRARGGAGVLVGIGDDAAVFAPSALPTVVTCDTMVEGVHFRLDLTSPQALGRKLLAVNLSDVAAMGARPTTALLMMSLRQDLPRATWEGLRDGFCSLADEHEVAIVGGDTTRTDGPIVLSVVLHGEAPDPPLLRSGARPGDRVCVTGTVGDSALGLRLLLQRPDLASLHPRVVQRHLDPSPRVAVGMAVARARLASAAIDLSDGLVQDAGHVARLSGAAIRIELGRVPTSESFLAASAALGAADALTLRVAGGEDYELLLTIPPGRTIPDAIEGVPIAVIGEVVAGTPGEVTLLAPDGSTLALQRHGWDHF